ncbi:MAG: KOW domain-containing RNA-binding protein [Clostridia bacterium]|nr:KOW domain-containing RNA-binding protein [Clostridia bacterium]
MKKKQHTQNEKDRTYPVFDRTDTRVGSVCVSKAGHDTGDCLVIIAGIDRGHVYVADGKARKLIAPKKKKMRHLNMITKLSGPDAEVLRGGVYNDSFLRKVLSRAKSEKLT